MIRTAPRIKLLVADEDYKEKLKWLAYVGNDLRNARNDIMRECVAYLQKQINGEDIPLKANGKSISYEGYVRKNKKIYEFATLSLLNWTEFFTVKVFRQYKKKILRGETNIPMFRDMAIPVNAKGSKIWKGDDGELYIQPRAMHKIVFRMVNPYKNRSLCAILERVLDGTYPVGFSKLIRDGKQWYLHLSYEVEPLKPQLDPDLICGIDLGMEKPAVCGLAKGYDRAYLGDSGHLKMFKNQIRKRRRMLQRERHNMKKGHGTARATKALAQIERKEANFVKTFNHKISKNVIDFCLKHNAGTIHMEALTHHVKKNKMLTAYWSYYQLQNMVQYKAEEHGIEVKFINPKNTSRRCADCGYIDKANRPDQATFKCVACGYTANADYNAAVNIARSTAFVKEGRLEEAEDTSVSGVDYTA